MFQLIADHEYGALALLLNEVPELNAHFSAMLIQHGFQNEHMSTWVRFKGNLMIAAIAVYRGSAVVYERERPHYKDLIDFLSWQRVKSLSGPRYVIDSLRGHLPYKQVEHTIVARLDRLDKVMEAHEGQGDEESGNVLLESYRRHWLSEKIVLQNKIFKLQVDPNHEGIFVLFDKKVLRGYVIRSNDEIVATGEWLNNHPTFGLILGIATHEKFRRKHYAQYISSKLCVDIVSKGKTPLLRYQDEVAGALYRKIGFVDVAEFSSLYFV